MTATSQTPARGVQLIDRHQWRAIVAVAVLAALALAAALYGLRAAPRPLPAPVVHVAAPACPACPAAPACTCAACAACPAAPERHRR